MSTNHGNIFTGDTTLQVPLALPPPADVSATHGLHNLPRPVGQRFVGRMSEMAALEQALRPRNERAATHVVAQAMSGLGGIGKSTLALHFAHTHRSDYTAVWWIDAETPETITSSLAQLTTRVNAGTNTSSLPSAVLAEWALTWLDSHPGWLLVFDNATHPDHLAPYLARLTSGDHLITSRLTYGWHDLAATPLHLDVLTPPAATNLLHQLAGPGPSSEAAAAQELADELGYLPLALEQAGAYIRRTRNTYSGYLHRLRTRTARMLNTPGNGDPHSITIARTWRVTLDTIAERDPLAVHLLRVMAWFAPHDVPRDILSGVADEPETGIDDAIALLNDFSMITLSQSTATTHRLVQALARTPDPQDPHRTESAIAKAQSIAACLINRALPDDPSSNVAGWPRWRALLPHIDAYLTHTRPDADTACCNHLLHQASRFLRGQGQIGQATRYALRSAATAVRLNGEDHPFTLASRNDLAGAYESAGDLARAVPLYEQTLADSIRILGEDHPSTLTTRDNLAGVYESAGHLARAMRLYEETLAARVRVLGEDHPDALATRNNLGYAYGKAGDWGRAIRLYEETLAARVWVLGEDHPSTLTTRSNLALAYAETGDPGHAIHLYEQTLADSIRVLGEDHPSTLTTRNNLAGVYKTAGDLARAMRLYEETLAARIRVLGEDHPSTLITRSNLALTYAEVGDPGRAVHLDEETLAARIRVLGEDHPDTLASRNNLAYVYGETGDSSRAIHLYEQTLADSIRILGEDHPVTRTVRNNLRAALVLAHFATELM
ncbi:FxSxx-COOH system tetratricopeptide repeat protein [Streptomyces sp. DSM 41524]|uniref:FxSxx-COOH system tetratricopeptide repeat protein n=1 Tax=Streptomyces asiaticus subsp. ignotus TaxID=3098222 RepID=A0ABU7Q1F5_9ACTN|nr:FxSxx-COOH system tetratricopeptide repeat protein [Streptomyces sp. DSM 41524]